MLILVLVFILLLSLPYWLPTIFVHLRMFIFTCVNGKEGLQIPNKTFDAQDFQRIYASPSADGRSKGAGLSDLFWYWLSPGPEMHQEHLEKGLRYQKIAAFTKEILTVSREEMEALLDKCLRHALVIDIEKGWGLERVRDFMMPVFAEFYYELVFKEACPPQARELIVGHANDVVTALKCCGFRHMKKRKALTDFLLKKLKGYTFLKPFPEEFTLLEEVYYLQGVFFNTAIVQMSDAISHIIMILATHRDIQEKMAKNPRDRVFYNSVINETLRLYPLFGIAHRVLSGDIETEHGIVKRNSVVCFNYAKYHLEDFKNPEVFDPTRWETCPAQYKNYTPFGIKENRPCPAKAASLISIRKVTEFLLSRYSFVSSAKHTRSQPNKSPVLVMICNKKGLSERDKLWILRFIKLKDLWEDVFRSMMQFVCGTIMILDARRVKLCTNYFKSRREIDSADDPKTSEC